MGTGKQPSKIAILVVGVHRSGTSPLTRVLNLLGCTLPRNLIPASSANETGFWEAGSVNRLNDEVLAAAGANWRTLQKLPAGWSRQPAGAELKAKATAVLQSEFGDASLFVLKDPRLCRLMPFWCDVLERFDARPVVVCPIRNPLEVAASMEKRNALHPRSSYYIWLRYVLDAEAGTRRLPRTFVHYEALLSDWRPVVARVSAELGISLPRTAQDAAADIQAFLSPAHRHHVSSAENVDRKAALPESARRTYKIVDRWARAGERRADFRTLDRFRRELDDIPPEFAAFSQSQSDELREVRNNLARSSAELASRAAESKSAVEYLQLAKADLEKTKRELATREAEAAAAATQLSDASSRLAGAQRLLSQRDAESVARTQELQEFKSRLAETAAQLARRHAEAYANAEHINELKARLVQVARDLAGREADLETRNAQLAAAANELSQTRTQLAADAEAKAQLQELRSRFDETVRQLARSDAESHANAEHINGLKAQLARSDAESYANAEHINGLKAQLARLAADLAERDADLKRKTAKLTKALAAPEELTRQLKAEKEERAALQAKFERTQADLARTRKHLPRLEADVASARRERDDARRQVERLEAELRRIHATRLWKLGQTLDSATQLVRGVAGRVRSRSDKLAKKAAQLVASSNLFDRDWYLAQYPDVAAAGIDPALHYVLHGAEEGRNPGPGFLTKWYLDTHKDVAAAGVNPLVHYLEHGRAEGREIAPVVQHALGVAKAPEELPVPTEAPVAPAEPVSYPVPAPAISGWLRHAEMQRRDGFIPAELSDVLLGTVRAERAVPGLSQALAAFCRLMRKPGAADVSAVMPMADLAIGDVWYVSDRDLRVRFDTRGAAGPGCVTRFFQYDADAADRLSLVGESALEAGATHFVDVALSNAFFPVLVTTATADGELLSATLLPFPSLCRGGLHHGELYAKQGETAYLERLQSVSDALLKEMLDGAGSVARIELDLQGATGAERIFSPDLGAWLAAIMNVQLLPANCAAVAKPRVRAYLEERLARSAARCEKARDGALALTLPPDAVPSIHALVCRAPLLPSTAESAVASFIVSEICAGAPRWLVRTPAMGDQLLRLQGKGLASSFPVVSRLAKEAGTAEAAAPAQIPLAVRFCPMGERDPAQVAMPFAPEVPGPLLRKANGAPRNIAPTLSVVLPPHLGDAMLLAMVEALRLQATAAPFEVVATVDAKGGSATARILERYFAGAYQVIEGDKTSARAAAINRAAEAAKGELLLIAAAPVILHDPRTLETLCAIAEDESVASAGCVLVKAEWMKKIQVPVVHSAGIFPRQDAEEVLFSELDCFGVFRLATYPVAANSSALFVVRAGTWRALGGFDAAGFPDAQADIDYGVRAISQGYVHLCTSAVCAELCDPAFRPAYANAVLAPHSRAAGALRTLGASATLLEAVQA